MTKKQTKSETSADVEPNPTAKTDALETVNRSVRPSELKLLDKNAHFMSEQVFKQLCDNIRRDGCLTSAPLVAMVEGKLLVLSGNHRVKASLAVGLAEIPVIEVLGELSPSRLVGIQLSHNALNGDDDTNILRELYDSLDLIEQRYSGLTDEDLGVLNDPDLQKLSVGMPAYEEIMVSFLPEDLTEFNDNLEKLKKKSEKYPAYWAKFSDYQTFFEGVFAVKDAEKIGNDGVALLVMSQLALNYLKEKSDDAGAVSDG